MASDSARRRVEALHALHKRSGLPPPASVDAVDEALQRALRGGAAAATRAAAGLVDFVNLYGDSPTPAVGVVLQAAVSRCTATVTAADAHPLAAALRAVAPTVLHDASRANFAALVTLLDAAPAPAPAGHAGAVAWQWFSQQRQLLLVTALDPLPAAAAYVERLLAGDVEAGEALGKIAPALADALRDAATEDARPRLEAALAAIVQAPSQPSAGDGAATPATSAEVAATPSTTSDVTAATSQPSMQLEPAPEALQEAATTSPTSMELEPPAGEVGGAAPSSSMGATGLTAASSSAASSTPTPNPRKRPRNPGHDVDRRIVVRFRKAGTEAGWVECVVYMKLLSDKRLDAWLPRVLGADDGVVYDVRTFRNMADAARKVCDWVTMDHVVEQPTLLVRQQERVGGAWEWRTCSD